MTETSGKNYKRWLLLFLLAASSGVIFRVAYLRGDFYPALRAALDINNEQLGFLSSIYGTASLFFYPLGGLLSDRVQAKYLLTFSLAGSGVLTLWYASMPSYGTLRVIFFLLAVTNILTFWSAFLKAVRGLGDDSEQGKIFGFNDGFWALTATTFSFIVVWIIGSADAEYNALVTTLTMYGIVYLAAAALVFIFLPKDDPDAVRETGGKVVLSQIAELLKTPGIWAVSLLVFSAYSVWGAASYLVPYLSDVYGLDPSSKLLNSLGVIRSYAIGILASPFAGMLADRIGSPNRFIRYCFVAAICFLVAFYFLPVQDSLFVPVLLLIGLSTLVGFMRGTYYATMPESGISLAMTGTATGIISIIGYLPDSFQYSMMGRWLDQNPGIEGYQMIFAYLAVVCFLGIGGASYALYRKKKLTAAVSEKAAVSN